MPVVAHCMMDSPLGVLTLVNRDGVLSGLYLPDHQGGPDVSALGPCTSAGFDAVRAELGEYFAGARREFSVPVDLQGTAFQLSVWALLRAIPYGETRSYGQLADTLGKRAAIRALGVANGRNPISIVVPCHRVVGSDGSLTGYAGGLERKQALLELEGARPGRLGLG